MWADRSYLGWLLPVALRAAAVYAALLECAEAVVFVDSLQRALAGAAGLGQYSSHVRGNSHSVTWVGDAYERSSGTRGALFSCSVAWSASVPRIVSGPTVAEQYLLSAANAERAQRGLQPLHWDRALYDAANYHAEQMAGRESISHRYDGEPELTVRGQQAGARFSVISENVAEAPSAVMIQDAWMNSEKHRENLLDPRVDSIGIRVIERGDRLYAVEDFDRSVTNLSLEQQEVAVGQLLQLRSAVRCLPTTQDARRTCSMESGYAGDLQAMVCDAVYGR